MHQVDTPDAQPVGMGQRLTDDPTLDAAPEPAQTPQQRAGDGRGGQGNSQRDQQRLQVAALARLLDRLLKQGRGTLRLGARREQAVVHGVGGNDGEHHRAVELHHRAFGAILRGHHQLAA